RGEDREVDDVAAPADQRETDELVPVGRPPDPVPDPGVRPDGDVLGAHRGEGTRKCERTRPATSAIDHGRSASRPSRSTPVMISAPSESLRCSDPCEPPPTWSTPPQSTNSWPGAAESSRSPDVGQSSAA